MKRTRILALVLGLMLMSGSGWTSGSAQSDRNCDAFDTHAEAQAYFDRAGGSSSRNVDLLDGDHDGVPCERLIRQGPVERAIDTVTGSGIGAVATGVILIALAGFGGGGIWLLRRKRSSSAIEPISSGAAQASILIPPLRENETGGYLVVKIDTFDSGNVPPKCELWINDVQHEIHTGSAGQPASPPEIMVELVSGEYQIHIRHCAPYAEHGQTAFVARDDISRVSIVLRADQS